MRQVKKAILWLALALLLVCGAYSAYASDDNSLVDLGITTEGVTVTPEFTGSTWTVDVTVPAGTTELQLDPVPSSDSATIAEISGTKLGEDGTGTVYITVQAASGARFTYTLNVTSDGEAPAAAPAESDPPQTEAPETEAAPQTEAPTEPATEDSRFVRVDRNTIQEAENTITNLKSDIAKYRDTISLYTKIMYGLIAVAVLLLFIIINLILRKRDLKAELNDYRSLAAKQPGRAPVQRPAAPQGASGQNVQAPQGQISGQIRKGQIQYNTPAGTLDVTPQTSTHREKRLPAYQEEGKSIKAQAVGREAAGAENGRQGEASPEQSAPAAKGAAGKNVEVDMIEL